MIIIINNSELTSLMQSLTGAKLMANSRTVATFNIQTTLKAS